MLFLDVDILPISIEEKSLQILGAQEVAQVQGTHQKRNSLHN